MTTTTTHDHGRTALVHGDARQQLLERMPVTERRLRLAGVPTSVLEGGEGGRPLVLLHGPGEFSERWLRVIPELVGDHRVIAPDLPGHGASEAAPEGELSPSLVLRWLDEVIDETCPTAPVLVGHLLGGAIAARYAVANGDRIAGLVLVDSFGLGPFRPAPTFALALVRFLARPSERSYERFMGHCWVDRDGVREGLRDDYELLRDYALDRARDPGVKSAMRSAMRQLGVPVIPERDLARIEAPTTLIWGRHDRANRLRIGEAASARHGWPLHVIDGAADDPVVERPLEFARALREALTTIERRRP